MKKIDVLKDFRAVDVVEILSFIKNRYGITEHNSGLMSELVAMTLELSLMDPESELIQSMRRRASRLISTAQFLVTKTPGESSNDWQALLSRVRQRRYRRRAKRIQKNASMRPDIEVGKGTLIEMEKIKNRFGFLTFEQLIQYLILADNRSTKRFVEVMQKLMMQLKLPVNESTLNALTSLLDNERYELMRKVIASEETRRINQRQDSRLRLLMAFGMGPDFKLHPDLRESRQTSLNEASGNKGDRNVEESIADMFEDFEEEDSQDFDLED